MATAKDSKGGPRGFSRVHLGHPDGSFLTCLLPLDEFGNLDRTAPTTWLVKCRWGSDELLGELHVSPRGLNRIVWSHPDHDDSATTLGTTPIKVGALVTVHDDDEFSMPWAFVVRNVWPG